MAVTFYSPRARKSSKKIMAVLRAARRPLTYDELHEWTGYSRPTLYAATKELLALGLIAPLDTPQRGRGHKTRFIAIAPNARKDQQRKNVKFSPQYTKNIYRTHTKDAGASEGVTQARVGGRSSGSTPRQTTDYPDSEAARITLVLGARFYRHVMQSVRLGLEQWALPEPIRDALEGFYGLRIDGASLAYARQLKEQIWGLQREIEALAAQGAPPRRVISFIASRLAGIPDRRAKREVLRRTAQLINDLDSLERRIVGLRAWLSDREADYKAGHVCKRCGYRHSEREYQSGYRDDGAGLVCFGFARVKLDELREMLKLQRRAQTCRACGGSLREGQVEGLCWRCWDQTRRSLSVRLG